MRISRLTAAGAAAVLVLGGTIAGAADPESANQTVTITVEEVPRSVSVGDDPELVVTAGQNLGERLGPSRTQNVVAFSSLAFENNTESTAKITAQVTKLNDVDGPSSSAWTAVFGATGTGNTQAAGMRLAVRTTARALPGEPANPAVGLPGNDALAVFFEQFCTTAGPCDVRQDIPANSTSASLSGTHEAVVEYRLYGDEAPDAGEITVEIRFTIE